MAMAKVSPELTQFQKMKVLKLGRKLETDFNIVVRDRDKITQGARRVETVTRAINTCWASCGPLMGASNNEVSQAHGSPPMESTFCQNFLGHARTTCQNLAETLSPLAANALESPKSRCPPKKRRQFADIGRQYTIVAHALKFADILATSADHNHQNVADDWPATPQELPPLGGDGCPHR